MTLRHEDVTTLCIRRGEEIKQLRTINDDLLAALVAVEWGTDHWDGSPACPSCGSVEGDDTHLDNCQLHRAIEKATK